MRDHSEQFVEVGKVFACFFYFPEFILESHANKRHVSICKHYVSRRKVLSTFRWWCFCHVTWNTLTRTVFELCDTFDGIVSRVLTPESDLLRAEFYAWWSWRTSHEWGCRSFRETEKQ